MSSSVLKGMVADDVDLLDLRRYALTEHQFKINTVAR